MAIVRLQEKGILTLDDPKTKYLSTAMLNKIANGKVISSMRSEAYSLLQKKTKESERIIEIIQHNEAKFTC